MIDSGAYSAHTKKLVLDVKRYGEWLIEHQDFWKVAVNLDVIPKEAGDAEEAAKKSLHNYEVLTDMGLPVMPVYHYGESITWLKEIAKLEPRVVGLGGIAKAPSSVRKYWLARVYDTIGQRKTHLFGVSAVDPIKKFRPWQYDSVACQQLAANGHFHVLHGRYTYKLHYHDLHGERARIVTEHAEKLGLTLRQVRDHYWARARLSAFAMNNFEPASRFYAGLSLDLKYLTHSFLPAGCRRILISYYMMEFADQPIRMAKVLKAIETYNAGIDDVG